MAEDIAPALLNRIQKNFHARLEKAGATKAANVKRARDGTLKSVTAYTNKVGKSLSRAFIDEITVEVLPDGVLYYNIAQKAIVPPIKEAWSMVSDVADEIQIRNNAKAGIGIKPIRPPIQKERLDGLIELIVNGNFADNIHHLNEPVRNIVDHFGDYHTEKNTEFLSNSGIDIYITRTAEATACEWCRDREGTYRGYREAHDNQVFERHEGCRCDVTISSGNSSGKMRASGHGFTRTR